MRPNTQSKLVNQACIEGGLAPSRSLFRFQLKYLVQMPIKINLIIFKSFIFFKQVFVTTHVREDLGKHERENFGVQQLPLFNLLEPEELDWRIRHS